VTTQLRNLELPMPPGLHCMAHARIEGKGKDTQLCWSVTVSGSGIKAWTSGRETIAKQPKSFDDPEFVQYVDSKLGPAVALCRARVDAAMGVAA
jgi:hypothetical protein